MISIYPRFSGIVLDQKPVFDTYANKFGYYSDFNFTSIFSWNTDNSAGASLLNDNLVICLPDYITGEKCYSLIGNSKLDESISLLLEAANELKLVPESVITNIKNPAGFKITEDPDNYDYIYLVKDLVEMPGKKFKDIRNKISKFQREYPEFNNLELSVSNKVEESKIDSFQTVFKVWAEHKHVSREDYEQEQIAIDRLLKNSRHLSLIIMDVTLNKKVQAFSVYEILAPNYAICHFEKYAPNHPHYGPYLVKQTIGVLDKLGIEKLNWEQDLGLPGLKRLKEYYRPVEMLKKYRITKA
jgi:hypothetical protein